MREIVSSGRSVEEAINEGLELLGVTRDAVRVEVLDEGTKGLFGLLGGRMARVRLTVTDGEEHPAEKEPEQGDEGDEAKEAELSGAEVPSQVLRDEKTMMAKSFLSGLVKRMGVQGDLVSKDDGEYVTLEITGRKLGILIGRRGQTLDAIQYLVNVAANADGKGWVRFVVDAEDYRKRREDTLRQLAMRVADKAKMYGRRQVLEPMTPQERRIIHTALQEDPDIMTYSEGEEPYRRVIVGLRNERGGERIGERHGESSRDRSGGRRERDGSARYGHGGRGGGRGNSI